ncbi:MAG TPA: hypothetical protein VEB21_16905 [Terriglobales bacterium]|nr:hypothetical protein [Terriglobales bacterium]
MRIERALVMLCIAAAPATAQIAGPDGNLPLPPGEMIRRMCEEPFDIVEAQGAGGGVMGAKRWTLQYADGLKLKVKWKQAPKGGDGWNNSPRLEVAAYQIQRMFLDPDDHVVPPVCGRCVPFKTYQAVDDDHEANLPEGQCVFGSFSAWLQNVRQPDRAYDPKRFSRDPAYARHFAHLNLLTYLISQHDARGNNFLMSTDPQNPQIFSIDNGISFDVWFYNWFAWHLNEIRVGGLEHGAIERLRQVTQAQLDALGVVEQFEREPDGIYRRVAVGANLNPMEGARLSGTTFQYGLTEVEIGALSQRLRHLLRRIDAGELVLF